MRSFDHLTRQQLSDYSMRSIGEKPLHEIGKHLLGCEACRAELRPPTPAQFLNALMYEATSENRDLVEDKSHGLFETLKALIYPLRQKRILVLAGAALLVLLGTSFLLLLNRSEQPTIDTEIAQSFETEGPESKFRGDGIIEPVQKETNDGGPRSADPRLTDSNKGLEPLNRNRLALKTSLPNRPGNKAKGKLPRAGSENVSPSRGVISRCSDQRSIGIEFTASRGTVVLKWEKVPKAVKYHLYISDDEEILVDEYETTQETSYVLKKTLYKGKIYKWKVVIELENGRTLIGVSQKFTSKDFQPNQKGIVKRLNTEIRCSSIN